MMQSESGFSVLLLVSLFIEAFLHKRTTFQQAIIFKRSTIFKRTASVSYNCSARICGTEIKMVRRDVLFERPIVQLFPPIFSKHVTVDISCGAAVKRAVGMTLFSDATVLMRVFPSCKYTPRVDVGHMMERHLDFFHKSTDGV